MKSNCSRSGFDLLIELMVCQIIHWLDRLAPWDVGEPEFRYSVTKATLTRSNESLSSYRVAEIRSFNKVFILPSY
jgi:hypothetical protein